jgi:deoxyadenosine/deoxycytidine kinase
MYILEGNIGVGKSTFLELLHQHSPDIAVVQEPKDNWASHQHGQSLLESFYQNPHRWAYTIETLAMISRVKDHTLEQEKANPNRILERSVYSGHYCFALNDHHLGYFKDFEWEMYNRWVEFLVHNHCRPPRGFIYLQADPEVCFARMKKRNRRGEEGITFEYIEQIGHLHERFFIQREGIASYLKTIPVLVLDCSYNLIENNVLLGKYIQQIRKFLSETQL